MQDDTAKETNGYPGNVTPLPQSRRGEPAVREAIRRARKERLIMQLLDASGDGYVGEREIFSLAFGMFDEETDRRRVANHIDNIRRKCERLLGPNLIEQDPRRGYKLGALRPRPREP